MADEKYAAAKPTAESRGFDHVPAGVLLRRIFQENLPRLMAAAGTVAEPMAPAVTEALLGGVDVALPPLRVFFEEFVALTKMKHMRKSDRQRHQCIHIRRNLRPQCGRVSKWHGTRLLPVGEQPTMPRAFGKTIVPGAALSVELSIDAPDAILAQTI